MIDLSAFIHKHGGQYLYTRAAVIAKRILIIVVKIDFVLQGYN